MKLLTKEIIKKLESHPLRCQEGKMDDAKVLVKFFNPYGTGTWLVTEAEKKENGDWLFFGKAHLFEWEWGYFNFSELNELRVPPFNMPIERDMYSAMTTVGQMAH